jgi:FeS assembly SUF system protein
VIAAIKTVYDPEIPINIWEVGLIYDVSVNSTGWARVLMTLTSPNCPVAESLPIEVRERVADVDGVTDVDVEITWDPPWDPDMMSEAARLELGFD